MGEENAVLVGQIDKMLSNLQKEVNSNTDSKFKKVQTVLEEIKKITMKQRRE